MRGVALKLTLAFMLALCLLPTPAHAAFPDEFALPTYRPSEGAVRVQPPEICDDRHMLAFLIQTEAFSQPDAAKIAIAQIIKREAASRGITICALARFSWFVAPYRYLLAHPDSWQARQWHQIQWWSDQMADDVLHERLPPALPDSFGHFDGRSHGGDEIVIGQTFFRP